MTQLYLIISGRVQGVGFRFFVEHHAGRLGITGHAKNLHDGTVEVIAYGEKGVLDELLKHCRQGPRSARVNDIHVEWSEAEAVPHEFIVR